MRGLLIRLRSRGRVRVCAGVRLGRRVRIEAGPGARVALAAGCRLGDGCRIVARGGAVTVGQRAVLGERCTLIAHGGIDLGAGCVLGDMVTIVDFDHRSDDVERPVRLQGLRVEPVRVGAEAVIGHGASLLRGVTVGDGARVGEHAVVTRDVPQGARVEGVPARGR